VTLNKCKREEAFGVRKRLEIEDDADVVRKSRLGWLDHMERKDAGDCVSALRNRLL